MPLGPLGNTTGLSGSQNDAANQVRRTAANQKSEKAGGLGAADADQHTGERDADGRRLWERPAEEQEQNSQQQEETIEALNPQSKDPTGNSGRLLDLTG